MGAENMPDKMKPLVTGGGGGGTAVIPTARIGGRRVACSEQLLLRRGKSMFGQLQPHVYSLTTKHNCVPLLQVMQ